ncbi:hypothetical protein B6U90_06915 [Thermoplasmatales archaeon ex4484_6]|nr:MAG: hypothetical protein B6U90_06915 [Thermoplasmatales archaeon ex4484_6]
MMIIIGIPPGIHRKLPRDGSASRKHLLGIRAFQGREEENLPTLLFPLEGVEYMGKKGIVIVAAAAALIVMALVIGGIIAAVLLISPSGNSGGGSP